MITKSNLKFYIENSSDIKEIYISIIEEQIKFLRKEKPLESITTEDFIDTKAIINHLKFIKGVDVKKELEKIQEKIDY